MKDEKNLQDTNQKEDFLIKGAEKFLNAKPGSMRYPGRKKS